MVVNGKEVELGALDVKTLLELVRHYKLEPRAVAVEMNGEIPSRCGWEQIFLKESDRIELIRFVGGG